MNSSQVFAVTLIVLGLFGVWLESQCKLGAIVQEIQKEI